MIEWAITAPGWVESSEKWGLFPCVPHFCLLPALSFSTGHGSHFWDEEPTLNLPWSFIFPFLQPKAANCVINAEGDGSCTAGWLSGELRSVLRDLQLGKRPLVPRLNSYSEKIWLFFARVVFCIWDPVFSGDRKANLFRKKQHEGWKGRRTLCSWRWAKSSARRVSVSVSDNVDLDVSTPRSQWSLSSIHGLLPNFLILLKSSAFAK